MARDLQGLVRWGAIAVFQEGKKRGEKRGVAKLDFPFPCIFCGPLFPPLFSFSVSLIEFYFIELFATRTLLRSDNCAKLKGVREEGLSLCRKMATLCDH